MSEKFEIELVSKRCLSLIGVADDAESAINVMDVAMRGIRPVTFESSAGA
jgi:hypothetical protein